MPTINTTIPKGYKQTEVGTIPDDWDVKPLGELFYFSGGFTASREQLSDEGFCYLHYGDIHKSNRTYIDVGNEYLEIPKLKIPFNLIPKKSLLNDGDVVFVDASEDDEGASKHVVVRNKKGITYISGLHTIVSKSKDNSIENPYRQFCFQTDSVKKQFKFFAVGTKVTGISKTNIARIQIAFPSKVEQIAIANILSSADALIEKLEKLIEKKKNIKQGVMQELLTGKCHLPGFRGKWKQISLGKLAQIYQPQTISQSKFSKDGYLVYGANGIVGRYKNYNHEKWQTIITCRGSTCGTVNRTVDQCWITGNAMVINIDQNNSIDKLFFYYLLSRQDFSTCITGTGQPQIVRNPLFIFEVRFPIDKAEQIAIASTLSDMDTEIGSLKQQLKKYKQVKTGMMQQLLTGKIRII